MIQRSETQAVHRRNRPRAHRENISQNSADAGRRTLKRFNERRMIVRLNLERGAPAVTEIHDARVFARRDDYAWSSCWQTFYVNARRFVRAVFGPHDREDSEFGKTRFSAKQFLYSLEFLLREVMGGDNFIMDT